MWNRLPPLQKSRNTDSQVMGCLRDAHFPWCLLVIELPKDQHFQMSLSNSKYLVKLRKRHLLFLDDSLNSSRTVFHAQIHFSRKKKRKETFHPSPNLEVTALTSEKQKPEFQFLLCCVLTTSECCSFMLLNAKCHISNEAWLFRISCLICCVWLSMYQRQTNKQTKKDECWNIWYSNS